ncbi:unnamed protein product [Aureobasidium vineae]|uniref:Uncharacterized protein n=1 Tax=Aureobasidium vineae TaxID=2773715 RepID=A0A9N8JTN9_9PEZI|nr:unnamed protein product [Aureobasidium vineae]
MSATSRPNVGQEPSKNTNHRTFTRYPVAEAKTSVAGRRRVAPRVSNINTQACNNVRDEELQYTYLRDKMRGNPDTNKPLPPLPGKRSSSRPASPMDRAAHWVNKKVVTPVKEFFKTPEVNEMIGRTSQETGNQFSPRPYAMFTETKTSAEPKRHTRGKSSVDRREVAPRRSGSVSSRETFHSSPVTPRSRNSDNSMTSGVRHAIDTTQQVGSRLGLNHEAGRLVFSDAAPAGMMDPCSVCHKEPKGVLYHGRCRDCR